MSGSATSTPLTTPHPLTPVIVGVGEYAESVGSRGYAGCSPVELAARAARAALADTGVDVARIADDIDIVAGIRQFELCGLAPPNPMGRSTNFPRSVAARIGATPRRAILEIGGGQGPQHLLTEMAGALSDGDARAVLLVGSEALSTIRAAEADLAGSRRTAADLPDWREDPPGDLEDRGPGLEDMNSPMYAAHGLVGAIPAYALFENARRLQRGEPKAAYAREMGDLFAPFTQIAADNPLAAAPTRRTADELVTPSERNRMVADPYTRFLVARDQVNQGAAIVLTTVATADRLGVPSDRRVFLHGHADVVERDLLDRPDLATSPASVAAVHQALAMAGLEIEALSALDLYSCFPIAVSNITDAFGLHADDPRGLTATGGLPFFGGPGNNYSMHGIAAIVRRVRAAPGSPGLVTANGGILSKYSVGVYSTVPRDWQPPMPVPLPADPAPQHARMPVGRVRVETCTVVYERGIPTLGIAVARLAADDSRVLACTAPGDHRAIDALLAEEPRGIPLSVTQLGGLSILVAE